MSLPWNIALTAGSVMLIHATAPVLQLTHSFEISNGVSMRLVVHSLSPQTFPGKVQRCAGTKTIINRGRAVVRLCVWWPADPPPPSDEGTDQLVYLCGRQILISFHKTYLVIIIIQIQLLLRDPLGFAHEIN